MRADVANIESLSVHADLAEYGEWFKPFRQAPLAHHGELSAADPIRQHFEESLGWESFVPYHLEKMVMM